MQKQMIYFDFDGTIANSLVVAESVIHQLSDEFGFDKPNMQALQEWRSKGIAELMEITGMSWHQLPFIVKRARQLFRTKIEMVPVIQDLSPVLHKLSQKGHTLNILTSNTEKNVLLLLKKFELPYFSSIHAPNLLSGKAQIILKQAKKNHHSLLDTWMIGDEVRDIEAAKTAGVKSVAVTWGFNDKHLLEKYHPDYCISHPVELLSIF